VRKALVKFAEEMVVRSPAYGFLARLMFSGRRAGRFDRFYRRAHERVRGVAGAFTGFQARLALRRLARVDARDRRLNRLRDELVARLPARFVVQRRDGIGRRPRATTSSRCTMATSSRCARRRSGPGSIWASAAR